MTKKEYLQNRFKIDFLRYSLLQNDSISAKDIAEKLFRAIDLSWLNSSHKKELEIILDKYLSFDNLKVNGKLTNELPEKFEYGLKDIILAEYQNFIDSESSIEIANTIVANIEHFVELQTWDNGIVNIQESIDILIDRLRNVEESYENIYVAIVPENLLKEKYNQAKENTFFERIRGNNSEDIIEYRNTLMEYVRAKCEQIYNAKLKDIFNLIVSNEAFNRLHLNFDYLMQYAQELKGTIVDYTPNKEWDEEYDRLVPTDFYHRNVADISAEQAFHMVLLRFFARNEAWMIEKGVLVDGELGVYVSKDSQNVTNLLNLIIKNCEQEILRRAQ